LVDDVAGVIERIPDVGVHLGGETGAVTDDAIVLPEFHTVLEYVDAAIQDGLADEAVSAYLQRMGFDVKAYEPLAHEIERQNAVSRSEAREIRLRYAERLEQDVREANVMSAD
jgi:hypothetical protein